MTKKPLASAVASCPLADFHGQKQGFGQGRDVIDPAVRGDARQVHALKDLVSELIGGAVVIGHQSDVRAVWRGRDADARGVSISHTPSSLQVSLAGLQRSHPSSTSTDRAINRTGILLS